MMTHHESGYEKQEIQIRQQVENVLGPYIHSMLISKKISSYYFKPCPITHQKATKETTLKGLKDAVVSSPRSRVR